MRTRIRWPIITVLILLMLLVTSAAYAETNFFEGVFEAKWFMTAEEVENAIGLYDKRTPVAFAQSREILGRQAKINYIIHKENQKFFLAQIVFVESLENQVNLKERIGLFESTQHLLDAEYGDFTKKTPKNDEVLSTAKVFHNIPFDSGESQWRGKLKMFHDLTWVKNRLFETIIIETYRD